MSDSMHVRTERSVFNERRLEGSEGMVRTDSAEWYRSGRRGRQTKYEGRKGIIARAARAVLERKGIAKTSIADITREVNITRELFYYYFPNKDAVVAFVIEDYVSEARDLLSESLKTAGDELFSLLRHTMHALRSWLSLDDDKPVPMLAVLHEAGVEIQVLYRVAGEALLMLRGRLTTEREVSACDASANGRIAGLVGSMCVMRCDGRVTDEDLARDMMRLFSVGQED